MGHLGSNPDPTRRAPWCGPTPKATTEPTRVAKADRALSGRPSRLAKTELPPSFFEPATPPAPPLREKGSHQLAPGAASLVGLVQPRFVLALAFTASAPGSGRSTPTCQPAALGVRNRHAMRKVANSSPLRDPDLTKARTSPGNATASCRARTSWCIGSRSRGPQTLELDGGEVITRVARPTPYRAEAITTVANGSLHHGRAFAPVANTDLRCGEVFATPGSAPPCDAGRRLHAVGSPRCMAGGEGVCTRRDRPSARSRGPFEAVVIASLQAVGPFHRISAPHTPPRPPDARARPSTSPPPLPMPVPARSPTPARPRLLPLGTPPASALGP